MSLKSAPYYWVECDDCGISAQEGTDHSAWAEAWTALDQAQDYDFRTVVVDGGNPDHYCLSCAEKRGLMEEE